MAPPPPAARTPLDRRRATRLELARHRSLGPTHRPHLAHVALAALAGAVAGGVCVWLATLALDAYADAMEAIR